MHTSTDPISLISQSSFLMIDAIWIQQKIFFLESVLSIRHLYDDVYLETHRIISYTFFSSLEHSEILECMENHDCFEDEILWG